MASSGGRHCLRDQVQRLMPYIFVAIDFIGVFQFLVYAGRFCRLITTVHGAGVDEADILAPFLNHPTKGSSLSRLFDIFQSPQPMIW